jgi:hypothetical protein
MSIQEISSKFKLFLFRDDILVAGIIVLVGMGSFLLGKSWESSPEPQIIQREAAAVIQTTETQEVAVTHDPEVLPVTKVEAAAAALPEAGGYVASKNGTKYHLPWCSGAKRILEENKVWFKTKEEAEAAGYAAAANCPGI